jgi:PAS domain-containing protein
VGEAVTCAFVSNAPTPQPGKERIILLAIEDITGRRQLEDLAAEPEERYRRIFETASDGIVLLEKRFGPRVTAEPSRSTSIRLSFKPSGKQLRYLKRFSLGTKRDER